MPQSHDPALPADGLAALRAYIERGMSHVDDLQSVPLLRLRSAMTLQDRLDLCIDAGWALSPAMFSPADILTLNEIAAETPHDREEIVSLAHAIEEQMRPPRNG